MANLAGRFDSCLENQKAQFSNVVCFWGMLYCHRIIGGSDWMSMQECYKVCKLVCCRNSELVHDQISCKLTWRGRRGVSPVWWWCSRGGIGHCTYVSDKTYLSMMPMIVFLRGYKGMSQIGTCVFNHECKHIINIQKFHVLSGLDHGL